MSKVRLLVQDIHRFEESIRIQTEEIESLEENVGTIKIWLKAAKDELRVLRRDHEEGSESQGEV